jgi:hypothetical protein
MEGRVFKYRGFSITHTPSHSLKVPLWGVCSEEYLQKAQRVMNKNHVTNKSVAQSGLLVLKQLKSP